MHNIASTPDSTRNRPIQTTLLPVPISIPECLSQLELEAHIPIPNPTMQPSPSTDMPAHLNNTSTTPRYQATLEQCWDTFQDSSSNVRPNEA